MNAQTPDTDHVNPPINMKISVIKLKKKNCKGIFSPLIFGTVLFWCAGLPSLFVSLVNANVTTQLAFCSCFFPKPYVLSTYQTFSALLSILFISATLLPFTPISPFSSFQPFFFSLLKKMVSVATVEAQKAEISSSAIPPTNENHSSEELHVFRSKLPDIPISNNIPLHVYLFERLSEFKDRTCLIAGKNGETFTFAETHLICQKIAAGLTNIGIKKGDVIMTFLQNCSEFVFTFLASSMIGAVITTANPFYTKSEAFKQLKASHAKLIVTQSQYVDKFRDSAENDPKIGEDFSVVTIDDPPENCFHFSVLSEAEAEDMPKGVVIHPDDPVALPFSSGTTGLPKGVILTHKSLITGVAQLVDGDNPNLYLKHDDVVLCVLPLFHIFALNSVLLVSLRAGATVLLMQKFEIGALLELIQKHRVSVAAVVPPLVLALAKNPMVDSFDLSSIRLVLSGAAPLGKELEEALHRRVPQAIFGQVKRKTQCSCFLVFWFTYAKIDAF